MTAGENKQNHPLLVGIDIGSTTTKIAAIDAAEKEIIYSDYRRHNAKQLESVYQALKRFRETFADTPLRLILTGSGAKPISEVLQVPFIQEVVANSIALRKNYPHVRTAIELGGQDAKIIFFHRDETDGSLNVSDMRMNGSDDVQLYPRLPVAFPHGNQRILSHQQRISLVGGIERI